MRRLLCLLTIVASAVVLSAQARDTKTLDIYVVDVEGGNATLFIAPSGESLLIDTGNGGAGAERDVGRIMEAAKDAGIAQIDHLIMNNGTRKGGWPQVMRTLYTSPGFEDVWQMHFSLGFSKVYRGR